MAKILFISDNFIDESLGIMYLSSYLKANGHETNLTLLSEYKRIDELLKFIEKINPDLIGFSVMTPQVSTFRPITKIIKETTGRKIVWGGAHCMFMPEAVLRNEYVDIICTGEGEEALLTLMNRLDERKDYYDIPSLWIKKQDEWIKNDLGHLEDDLDKYPFPDRGLYYDKYVGLGNFTLKRVITQRGCPYDCSYCFEPMFKQMFKDKGKMVRRHSTRYIIDQIKELVRKYPTRSIHFSDDTFNLNKNWVMDFLSKYNKEIKLPFTCNISVLHIDDELIKSLKESRCNGVVFGLETGVEHIRMDILNKKISNHKYIEAAKLFRKYKLKFVPNTIFCLPEETLDDAIETIRFARSLKPYGFKAYVLKAYKGTNLAKFLVQKDLHEGVGEFTYKVKDVNHEHDTIKNMIWAGYLFVKFPLLMRFAKKIISSSISKFLKPLILISYWQDIIFFSVPLRQSWIYFWKSRKLFMEGIGNVQLDNYKKAKD